MSAPMILSNDLRNMKKWVVDIITNKEIISVNQGKLFFSSFFKNSVFNVFFFVKKMHFLNQGFSFMKKKKEKFSKLWYAHLLIAKMSKFLPKN